MKKILSIILVVLMLGFIFTACGKNNNISDGTTVIIVPETREQNNDETTTDPVAVPIPAKSDSAVLENGQTFTGRNPLALQQYLVEDPENSRGLSTKKVGYSYGVSKNAVAHTTSVNNQQYFEKNNFKAFCLDTKTTEKVLYLTFDNGYENGYTSKILDVLKEKQVTAAFFRTLPEVKENPEMIARMINEGHIVGNHSVKHPSFPTISRIEMANEIKGMDDYLRTNFGYSEPFFRFPMGEYSDCALDLVGSLGYTSVFWSVAYADWEINKQKGADYAFNIVTSRLHPGAVILLHSVSSDNAGALGRIIDWARNEGYSFRSLRDYPTV